MKRLLVIVLSAAATVGCGLVQAADNPADDGMNAIAHGRHIVEGIGMCNDCHTAVLENGQPDLANPLMGATLPFRPTVEMPFAEVAPQIAGLPTMTDADAVHFFMTGERPGGVPPRPPMPRYKMNRQEAEAVVAYLRSLAPKE